MVSHIRTRWSADSILQFLHNNRDELRARGVMKIGLFGSYARGDQTPDSDMDFLVTMRTPSYRDFMDLWHYLEDSFDCAVDLGEEAYLKDDIRSRVLREVRYVQDL